MTAKELFDKMLEENEECTSTEIMIAFAKFHVQKALQKAAKDAYMTGDSESTLYCSCRIKRDSILNAYDLNEIR